MKYVKVNIQKLIAALKPSQFREFKEAILKKEYKKYLDHVFKGEDRIYLPFETSTEIKIPNDIENFLSKKNLEIVDYKSGIAKNKEGRLAKIGKILNKDDEGKKLLDLFNTSRSGVKKKDELLIVISRHPYDIAGMSTGRGRGEPGDSETGWGWSSCMNLRSGINKHYIHKDIENGTIVAYVINSKDENINKPISRVLIKQYINIENKNDKVLFPEEKVYGENVKGFRKKLIEWLKTFQEFKGTYEFNSELYPDDEEDEFEEFLNEEEDRDELIVIGLGDKNSKKWEIRKLYYKNHPEDTECQDDKKWQVRRVYYDNNPDDKEAKYDKKWQIRIIWYENHPEDKDAKTDKIGKVRYVYYRNNPEDKDAKTDKYFIIVNRYYLNHPEEKRN